jgi:pimeloyl-ACP methyl ester carboxylesterase
MWDLKMPKAQIKSVQCCSPEGLHRMAYKEWGDPANPVALVCAHGVTRVSDDFDNLANELCDAYRVICPDIVGRGRSDWFKDANHYQIPQYISDIVTLLARVNARKVYWLGTSMGGLIGMGLASLEGSPICKLILNDIGPSLNADALARIGDYIGQQVRFEHFADAEAYIKSISTSFGAHTDSEWHKFAQDVLKQDKDGYWVRHYDLKLAVPFKAITVESAKQSEALLWAAYDAIHCPTLLVRGAESDLLNREVADAMTQRGPKAKLIEIADVGHAPTFVHADQIAIVKKFLHDE